MEFSIKQSSPEKQRSGCVVLGVFEGGKLSGAALALDKAAKHYLSDIIARGDMSGKAATTLLLHHVPNTLSERVLLVGLGKSTEFHAKQFLDAACAAMCAVQKTGAKDATLYLAELPVLSKDEGSGQAASTGSG